MTEQPLAALPEWAQEEAALHLGRVYPEARFLVCDGCDGDEWPCVPYRTLSALADALLALAAAEWGYDCYVDKGLAEYGLHCWHCPTCQADQKYGTPHEPWCTNPARAALAKLREG